MICPKAGCRVQIHSTDGALEVCPIPPLPSITAVDTVASVGMLFRPMANKASVYNCWDSRLYVGAMGGVGSGYLSQELLSKVQYAELSLTVEAPQLVGVTNAHIE